MAGIKHYPLVGCPEEFVAIVAGSFDGANGTDPATWTGSISGVSRTAEGDYTVTFEASYAQPMGGFASADAAGASAELVDCSTITAGTVDVECFASGVADDLDATTIYVVIFVRDTIIDRKSI